MADDKKPDSSDGDPFIDFVWALLAFYLLAQALTNLGAYFTSSGNGVSNRFSSNTFLLSGTTPVSSVDNPLNRKVVVSKNSADLLDVPGGKKIKTLHFGDRGKIIGGPQTVNGEKYWKVKMENGDEGWMREKDLSAFDVKLTPLSSFNSLIGTDVVSSKKTDVFSEPGGPKINEVSKGVKGTILEGPIVRDGKKYWHIKFENGVEGWVDEKALDSLDGKQTALSKKPSLIGETVSPNRNDVPIYDKPGGNIVSTRDESDEGKIIEGPLIVDGIRYWHVKFDDGTEGWVREDDLNHKEYSDLSIFAKVYKVFWKIIGLLKYLIILLTLGLIYFIYRLYKGITTLGKEEREKLYPKREVLPVDEKPVNKSWQKILELSLSQNESDWRLAIIEGDIMLANLLENLGIPGDGVGEKLKNVNPADFRTVNNAWEAHKVRNNIAHEGGDYLLNQREVNRVVELYKTVFEEFKVI